ncbi:MAG: hypothetical protein HFE60_04345 [Anaerotignum sp.]|nr:hypothetical protein [Anaerotignum sp.]
MMMQQMKDERVEQAKHKIYAELMLISYGIIVVSYCIKAIYFEMSMRQCATEFIILILAPLYQAVRSRQMGVVFGDVKTAWWRQMLPVLGIVVFLFGLVTARNYMNGKAAWVSANISTGMIFMASFFVIFAVVRFLVVYMERRRAEKLEREYDEED